MNDDVKAIAEAMRAKKPNFKDKQKRRGKSAPLVRAAQENVIARALKAMEKGK